MEVAEAPSSADGQPPAGEAPAMELSGQTPTATEADQDLEPSTQQGAPTTEPTPQQESPAAGSDSYQPRLLFVEETSPALSIFAEHLAGFATSIRDRQSSDLLVSQAAGILEVAVRLSPRDDRLARQLVSARLMLGDIPASLEALEHYRRLRPDDVLAQIRYVDLSAARMEVIEERLSYLVMVAQTDRVPAEVRSHAAVAASLVLREMMDEAAADSWLEQAVALDPYSPQALQMFYERRVETGASRAERVDALALLARSNVLQPSVLETLAEELAGAGLTDQANDIYLRTLQAYGALGIAPPLELLRDVSALLLVADRPDAAAQTIAGGVDLAARSGPESYSVTALADLHMLDLLSRKRLTPGEDQLLPASETAANTIRFMLSQVSAQIRNIPRPTTNPDGTTPQTPLVDVVADAAALADENAPESLVLLRVPYATLMANLAWLDLYFRAQPADPRMLEALASLVPQESLALRRLRGWQLWRQGQNEAAHETLLPISEQDRLARLAILLMDQNGGTEIEASASELLSSEPSGLVGAFLSDALRAHGARLQPAEDAAGVRDAFATLPAAVFGLLEPQSVRNFYSLTAEPRLARHGYGEPVLLSLSIRNNGRHTLTVGPEGVIKPVVRVDALVKGHLQEAHPFPAAAAMELWGSVRLDPGEKIEQTVRLDGPELSALLASLPQPTLTITAEVTANPAVVQSGEGPRHVVGPAGQARLAQRMVTRSGFPMDLSDPQLGSVIDSRLEQLRAGEALERLRTGQWTMGMIGSLNRAAQEQGVAEADARRLRELSGRMTDALVRAASNLSVSGPDAAANAFVKYAAAGTAAGSRELLLGELLASPAFEVRTLGLLAIPALISDRVLAANMVKPLAESDEDATVRRLAQDVMSRLAEMPATEPAAPQTQPAAALPQPGGQ